MTDIQELQRAKTYIDKLSKGINPFDDTDIPENEIINDVRLSRCLFYVSDVLGQVIANEGKIRRKTKDKFSISPEAVQDFRFSDTPLSIKDITKRINEIAENENMKRLTQRNIVNWLISMGLMQTVRREDAKIAKIPTIHGEKSGIITEVKSSIDGPYTVVMCNRIAQQFIIDNMESIMELL